MPDFSVTTLIAAAAGVFFVLLLMRSLRLPASFFERQKQLEELQKNQVLQEIAGGSQEANMNAEIEGSDEE